MKSGRFFENVTKWITALVATVLMVSAGMAEETGSRRVWHVCMRCPDKDAQSIGDALKRANPKDTILVYWEPEFPYYMEHLVIDKPVRIISHSAAADMLNYDYYPVLASVSREIVRITVPGVELIGFNIMYLQKPADCYDNRACYSDTVGIRLEAPAFIRQVAITNCATGILAAYDYSNLNTASTIIECRIGLPPDHGVTETGLAQTQNHYGMVLLGTRREGPRLGSGRDRIRNCSLIRNSQYGLVYTTGNEPIMEGNTVEFNGKGPFRVVRPGLDGEKRLIWVDFQPVEPVPDL